MKQKMYSQQKYKTNAQSFNDSTVYAVTVEDLIKLEFASKTSPEDGKTMD